MDVARSALAASLRSAAGLDADTAAAVVEQLRVGTATRESVVEFVGPGVDGAIREFLAAVRGGGGGGVVGSSGAGHSSSSAPPPPPPPPRHVAHPPITGAAPPPPGGRRGGALVIKAAKAKATDANEPPRPDRAVTNCLACGRVYDLRMAARPGSAATIAPADPATFPTGSSPADVAALIASGGVCQAPGCGARVSLFRGRRVEGDSSTTSAADALRDRLLAADVARADTVVLDDDGLASAADIDANVWLSSAEKEEMKAEADAVRAAAEEARKRRAVSVTLDLAGRRVLLAEEAGAAAADVAALTAALAPWRLEGGDEGGGASDGDAAALAGACPSLPVPRPVFGLPPKKKAVDVDAGAGAGEEDAGSYVPGYVPPEEGKSGGGRRRRGGGGRGGN